MKQRIVIYTHEAKTIKIDDVKNINYKSDTLFFQHTGYDGDTSSSMFRDIAGYSIYNYKDGE